MTEKLELDIPVLLPEVPDAADACVGRLVSTLSAKPGVERAHVLPADGDKPAKLCIHFDGAALPLPRVRELVRAAGAEISGQYGHATWQVEGIGHERRARTVGEILCQVPGVLQADASASGSVRVEYDKERVDEAAIVAALGKLKVKPGKRTGSDHAGDHAGHDHGADDHAGHDHGPGGHAEGAKKHGPGDGHDHAHANFLGPNTELIFALACGALLAIGFAIEKLVAGAPDWLPTAFYVGAYVFGGFFTLREAIDNLKLKKFEIDTLMLVAAAGAAALGAWAEGALLLFLFSLGHALEHYAMGRAKRAIEALAELAPAKATVRRDGQTAEIPVEELVVGDIVVVRPNERLPADGFVIRGSSAINQAPVTGESIPVDKQPVADIDTARAKPDAVDATSRVFAGTINGGAAIEIEVTRRSNESALAKVVKMVSEAETQKSPTQRFTDRFERVFVPAVLALSFILLFAWVVVDEPFRDSFYRAMAVLVAASPCALAIATPSAVLSGVARAARGGVLVKGGAPLENLGSLKAIAFDKTGTLTEGRPRITDVVPVEGASEEDLLALAVAVEGLSDHPLAQAIVKDGRERLPVDAARERLWLMPTTGTKLYRFVDNAWRAIYAELFDDAEKASIRGAFDRALSEAGLADERIWGERIEDRGSQITFSGLGQDAPLEAKEGWDPDRAKRTAIQKTLRAALPGISINLGGTTSIDVTRAGVDKGYGLQRLSKESGVPLDGMLFLGDAIYPGGNDYPAAEIGVDTVKVRDVSETTAVVSAIIACLKR